MTMIQSSAPGKLMLFGEHSVVYGYPCIVTAVDLRYHVSVENISTNQIIVDIPAVSQTRNKWKYTIEEIQNLTEYQRETSFVFAAIKRFYSEFNISSGINLSTSGPDISYGLGSSSAITVATIAALSALFQVELDKMGVFNMAYSTVLDVQGKGSGFDVAAAVFGGTIYYKIGGEVIEPLSVDNLPIIIGFSGKKVSTTSYIKNVSNLRDRYPVLINGIFDLMGQTVEQAKSELLAERWDKLGELANINQGLLDSLGVSTTKLDNLIDVAKANGAFGAKLSGAGGGDCMFAFVKSEHSRSVKTALEVADGQIISIPVNADGVRVNTR